MASNQFYKIYQLADILVSKYSYIQISLNKFQEFKEKEIWFANSNNPHYQLIRVSFFEAEQFIFDSSRVNEYIQYLSAYAKKPIRFLDIHITNSSYNIEFEPFDYLNLEENYNSGKDVSEYYPEIYHAVHNVDNEENEIRTIASRMVDSLKQRRKKLQKDNSKRAYITTSIIAICIFMQIVSSLMSVKYSEPSVLIFLGGLYNTFTLGLYQYYRLITYAFLHGGYLHLFFNMYALYVIGVFMENKLGHVKYSLLLFSSILIGGLTQGILCRNTVCVGMSAGIYGLFVCYIAILLASHVINLNQLLPTLMINIALNFMSSTAWAGHLGGAMAGFVFFYIIKEQDKKKQYPLYSLLAVMVIILLVKYTGHTTVNEFYMGTDQEIINILRNLGFNSHANNIFSKLVKFYTK